MGGAAPVAGRAGYQRRGRGKPEAPAWTPPTASPPPGPSSAVGAWEDPSSPGISQAPGRGPLPAMPAEPGLRGPEIRKLTGARGECTDAGPWLPNRRVPVRSRWPLALSPRALPTEAPGVLPSTAGCRRLGNEFGERQQILSSVRYLRGDIRPPLLSGCHLPARAPHRPPLHLFYFGLHSLCLFGPVLSLVATRSAALWFNLSKSSALREGDSSSSRSALGNGLGSQCGSAQIPIDVTDTVFMNVSKCFAFHWLLAVSFWKVGSFLALK